MRRYGFSTGAIAKGDFRAALQILEAVNTRVVELSALRLTEITPLAAALGSLNLKRYSHVSLHAPSKYPAEAEQMIVGQMRRFAARQIAIILHPDAIVDVNAWAAFGPFLCIENMDKRKHTGRTAEELSRFFRSFPDAKFCLDLGHAKQVDPTMNETRQLLREFGDRLLQVHLSELNSKSRHERLSIATVLSVQKIAHMIPEHIPVIIESEVDRTSMNQELEIALASFGESDVYFPDLRSTG
jgi:hypothetical protein